MRRTILVTGSGGFIGSAIAAMLRTADYDVRAGLRRIGAGAVPGEVACDLDRPAELAAAVAGVDTVVHCAYGEEHAMPTQCAALLQAMDDAGVRRIVYFSSIAVHGDGNGPIGAYASAKAECEALVRGWENKGEGRRAVILRPGIVYGARSRFWIHKFSERIRAGVWGDFGPSAAGPALLVHVDDMAAVVIAAVARLSEAGPPIPELDVVGPETPAWNAYFHALAGRLSEQPLAAIGPVRLVCLSSLGLFARIWRRLGLPGWGRVALAPTWGELSMFARTVPFDAAKLPEKLGVTPKIGLKEGLDRSFPVQETRPDP